MDKNKLNPKTSRFRGPMGFGGHGPSAGAGTEKARDFKKAIKRLALYLKPYRWQMLVVLLFVALSTSFIIIGPKIMGQATNQIVDNYTSMKAYDMLLSRLPDEARPPKGSTGAAIIDNLPQSELNKIPKSQLDTLRSLDLSSRPTFHFDKLRDTALLLLGLFFMSALFGYAHGWIMTSITQKITYNLRRQISQKINRLPLSYFDKRTYGEVLSRVTNDIDTISQTLNQSLSQIITSVIMLVGITVMMISISWTLTIITLLILPLSFVLIALVTRKSQPHFQRQQELLGDINGHIEEMYSGHQIMRVYNGQRASVAKFNKLNDKLYLSAWQAQFLSGLMMPLMMLVGNLGYVAVAIVGGWLAINGHIRIGDIQAFFQYVQQFNQPIQQSANIANILQSTAAATERVFEFLDEPDQLQDTVKATNPKKISGQVEFKNVSFGYSSKKAVIKGLSAIIKPGQRVAIVGPTGAGKTTLVNLLMRFYDIDSGDITIDGTSINSMPRESVRRLFSMVLQDTWLFSGTIRENIAYGAPTVTDTEVVKAAKQAHADHFIRSLPGGYDGMLDEEANNISQGEKQLLTIARAMLTRAPMLILDEATSSVDTRTEQLIQQAMDQLMKNKTSFVIAHRLSTIRDADLILVMNDGDIIEQGRHQELLDKGGFYASLYSSQFDDAINT